MYVLSRMFKQPTEGNISSLSIAYFGDAHIKNMVKARLEKRKLNAI